ncbi:hypothetical protein ACWM9A_03725 [Acetobacter pasteurianus]
MAKEIAISPDGFVAEIQGRSFLGEASLIAGCHEQTAPHPVLDDELVHV